MIASHDWLLFYGDIAFSPRYLVTRNFIHNWNKKRYNDILHKELFGCIIHLDKNLIMGDCILLWKGKKYIVKYIIGHNYFNGFLLIFHTLFSSLIFWICSVLILLWILANKPLWQALNEVISFVRHKIVLNTRKIYVIKILSHKPRLQLNYTSTQNFTRTLLVVSIRKMFPFQQWNIQQGKLQPTVVQSH